MKPSGDTGFSDNISGSGKISQIQFGGAITSMAVLGLAFHSTEASVIGVI